MIIMIRKTTKLLNYYMYHTAHLVIGRHSPLICDKVVQVSGWTTCSAGCAR